MDTSKAKEKLNAALTEAQGKLTAAEATASELRGKVNKLKGLLSKLDKPEELLEAWVNTEIGATKGGRSKGEPEPKVELTEQERKSVKSAILQAYKEEKKPIAQGKLRTVFNKGRDKEIDKATWQEIVDELVSEKKLEKKSQKGGAVHKAT